MSSVNPNTMGNKDEYVFRSFMRPDGIREFVIEKRSDVLKRMLSMGFSSYEPWSKKQMIEMVTCPYAPGGKKFQAKPVCVFEMEQQQQQQMKEMERLSRLFGLFLQIKGMESQSLSRW